MCKPNYNLLSLIMISQAAYFLDKDQETLNTINGEKLAWIKKYHAWCKLYLKSRTFPKEHAKTLQAIDNDPLFKMAKESENISFLILVMELTRIWVETIPKNRLPAFTVSKKKLAGGFRHFVPMMLLLKKKYPDKYKDKKDIIEDSKDAAKKVWGTINRHVLCAKYQYKGV